MNEKVLHLTISEEAFEALQENLDIARKTVDYCRGLLKEGPKEVVDQLGGVMDDLDECIRAHYQWAEGGKKGGRHG